MATLRRIALDDYEVELMEPDDEGSLQPRTQRLPVRAGLRYILSLPNTALTGEDMPIVLDISEQTQQAEDALLLDREEYEVLTRAVKNVRGLSLVWAPLMRAILRAPEVEAHA